MSAFSSLSAQATVDAEGWAISPLKVNGLSLLGKYTKAQVVAELGVPEIYIDSFYLESEYPEIRYQQYYYSNGAYFEFKNERFVGLRFDNPNSHFSINQMAKVGDNISKILLLHTSKINKVGPLKQEGSGDFKCLWFNIALNADASIRFYYNSNLIITNISFEVHE